MQQEITETGLKAKAEYYASHTEEQRSATGLEDIMRFEMNNQRKNLMSAFDKQIRIADPSLGTEFLEQVKAHYDKYGSKP